MDSLFTRLKPRKIIHWAAAPAGGAWLCLVAAGCGDSFAPDIDDEGNGLTYGTEPQPMPALESFAFDALGSAGRLVFERIYANGPISGVEVIDVAARSSWGFTGDLYQMPAVSPDGQTIAFATLSRYAAATPNRYYDLYSVDTHGGSLRKLSANDGQDRAPSWTPDGAEIFYFVVGQNFDPALYRRPLTGDAALKQRITIDLRCVDPDGPFRVSVNRQITFSASACQNSTSQVQGAGIFVSDGNGADIRRLVGGSVLTRPTARYHSPVWSPDGREIAFLELGWDTTRSQPNSTKVRIMDSAGTSLRTIVDLPIDYTSAIGTFAGGNEYSLAWSPDGNRIAFNHYTGALIANIYVIRTDGTGLTRITSAAATDRSLTWSN